MEIGDKFTFYSNGTHRKALFMEQTGEKIQCVICEDLMEGMEIEIHESQIITENQISIFDAGA